MSFHPKRPWILASLHSGVVQLWDYRMGTLIDRFDEHDGPVRGVHFHRTQPLFVSGGDDYKIKVWNYKNRRCLFTLLGHLDYIRTVQFHEEHPWIVSASDDQTIRVWNWQSRSCIAVLTGHNHYVMCAAFHAKEDLVVSASLDQTVRVWDISGLRKRSSAGGPGGPGGPGGDDDLMRLGQQMNSDLFGGGDAVVKYVLEGHDRGVNWAAFHPTLPLIVSGADDRQVKLWRMNDTKAWEVDTLRGHLNNVSCVMFHARQDIIVSNSEDKSVRVWDMSKRTGVQTYRREHDRFWILAAHPELNLLAAGHDSGMIVFKLERERPAYACHGGTLYFVKDRYLRAYDYASGRDNPLVSLRRAGSSAGPASGARSISYNPAENAVLVNSDADGGSYELLIIPREGGGARGGGEPSDSRRGQGQCAVFIARNRFAVLDKAHSEILIKNLRNEVTKKCTPAVPSLDAIFFAGTGSLLLRSEDRVALFDVQQRVVTAELSTPFVKYVVWNADMTQVALLSKHTVIIASRKLEHLCTVHETIRVKSGAWDECGVFVYTTLNHVKYCLPNGDSGIVRTLDNPVYLTRVQGDVACCLDRDGKNRTLQIDNTEYVFKLALVRRQYDRVLHMIRTAPLCGQAIIAYLQNKGYPEVALHFVRDERTRFNLAIECGNIEAALQAAHELDEKDAWHTLGVEALRQGNKDVVEFAYQKTKNFERLSFLYLIMGNTEKLQKMLKIADMRGDAMSRFHNALFLGDVEERVKILEEAGYAALAYVCAKTHGLDETAERLAGELEELPEMPTMADGGEPKLLVPPAPYLREDNWPLLTVSKSLFEQAFGASAGAGGGAGGEQAGGAMGMGEDDAMAMEDAGDAWGDGDDLDLGGEGGGDDSMGLGGEGDEDEDGSGGWEMEDLELPADVLAGAGGGAADISEAGPFVVPTPGVPAAQRWAQKTPLAAECAAAGDFDAAARLLHRQLGVVNLEPLRQHFVAAYLGSHAAMPGAPSAQGATLLVPLERGWSEQSGAAGTGAPAVVAKLSTLEDDLRRAYKWVTEGKFSEALRSFVRIMQSCFMLVVETRREVDEVKELLAIAAGYTAALRIELQRKEVAKEDPKRAVELAAYFTHAPGLQNVHLALALRSAMSSAFKAKCYGTSASMARRLVELAPAPKVMAQAKQVLGACEKAGLGDALDLDYDARNPFVTCNSAFTPIYKGSKTVACPASGAKYHPDAEGDVCGVSQVGKIGADGSGLMVSHSQAR